MPEMTKEAAAAVAQLDAAAMKNLGVSMPNDPDVLGKMTREDYLEAENINMRMKIFSQDLQLLQQQVQEKLRARDALANEMEALRQKLNAKYGVDVASITIEADGTLRKNKAPAL